MKYKTPKIKNILQKISIYKKVTKSALENTYKQYIFVEQIGKAHKK